MVDAAVFENRDAETLAVVEEFLAATNRGDVAGMTAVSHDDIVLVGTAPPGGTRYEGLDAVVALWREIFASCPDGRCEVEELIPAGDRCTALLRFVYDPRVRTDGCALLMCFDLKAARSSRSLRT
jgi:ketosteroid isomerase-like protein